MTRTFTQAQKRGTSLLLYSATVLLKFAKISNLEKTKSQKLKKYEKGKLDVKLGKMICTQAIGDFIQKKSNRPGEVPKIIFFHFWTKINFRAFLGVNHYILCYKIYCVI